MHICKLDIHVTPFRGDEFEELWTPCVSRVMDYGARGYSFTREQEDPLSFVQSSIWEEKLGFQKYWYSDEMAELRTEAMGLFHVPLLPHWSKLIAYKSVEEALASLK